MSAIRKIRRNMERPRKVASRKELRQRQLKERAEAEAARRKQEHAAPSS